jgi:hypothetical protein
VETRVTTRPIPYLAFLAVLATTFALVIVEASGYRSVAKLVPTGVAYVALGLIGIDLVRFILRLRAATLARVPRGDSTRDVAEVHGDGPHVVPLDRSLQQYGMWKTLVSLPMFLALNAVFGFVVASFLYIIALGRWLGFDRLAVLIAVAAAASAAVYLSGIGFQIPLPRGLLGRYIGL